MLWWILSLVWKFLMLYETSAIMSILSGYLSNLFLPTFIPGALDSVCYLLSALGILNIWYTVSVMLSCVLPPTIFKFMVLPCCHLQLLSFRKDFGNWIYNILSTSIGISFWFLLFQWCVKCSDFMLVFVASILEFYR